jgi:hypothetical protein
MGAQDEWFEPAVYRHPWYDWSASLRLVTGLWTRVRRRYLDEARLLRGDTYNPDATAFRIQVRVFELFADSAGVRGQRPLVVFFPDRWTVDQVRAGRAPVYQPLIAALRDRHIGFLDVAEAFRDAKPGVADAWFRPGGHYSAEGNHIVAAWLGPRLTVAPTHQSNDKD